MPACLPACLPALLALLCLEELCREVVEVQVVQAHVAVLAAGGKGAAVGVEGERVDGAEVALDAAELVAIQRTGAISVASPLASRISAVPFAVRVAEVLGTRICRRS